MPVWFSTNTFLQTRRVSIRTTAGAVKTRRIKKNSRR